MSKASQHRTATQHTSDLRRQLTTVRLELAAAQQLIAQQQTQLASLQTQLNTQQQCLEQLQSQLNPLKPPRHKKERTPRQ